MTQSNRLPDGGRIDREKPINFTFNGKQYAGYQGDTVASALLANDVRLVGRSFKYHRPRGVLGSGADEPNAILQLGQGARTTPNIPATQAEVFDGLVAESVNASPSVESDRLGILDRFSRFMPPGFYYKFFMWPRFMWKTYEHRIRASTGLGRAPSEPDPDQYDKMNTHCDVLVVGGGPAGLAAAVEAGRAGARVLLVEQEAEVGGSLFRGRQLLGGAPTEEWVQSAVSQLQDMEQVRLMTRSTALGLYEDNFVTVLERRVDHLPFDQATGARQRLWRIRANRVVLATGSIERPLVFPNNDRPGVMLASAVSTYLNRYAVAPGQRAVVFTNNDSAYQTALDLDAAGVTVAGVVDVRAKPQGPLPEAARQKGIYVVGGHAVVNVRGKKRISGVNIMRLNGDGDSVTGKARSLDCDLVAMSGGWNPTIHLHSQTGARPVFDPTRACFVPGESIQDESSVGSANGTFDLAGCLKEGAEAGAVAASEAGFGDGTVSNDLPSLDEPAEDPTLPMWVVPSPRRPGHGPKQFVDFHTDVSVSDILIAAREGYESVEHVKRYTTLGMGVDQGKLGNVNGIGILARELGKDIAEVGTTTFRPLYTAAAYGAVAGREVGHLFDPVRKTAMYGWHVEAGAEFENVGQWKRPWYYPRTGESMHDAVNRECLAVRNGVGIVDASTLGKIEIVGPDAATLFDRVYTNSWNRLRVGRCRYGLMLRENGMIMDDGVTARLAEDRYLMHTSSGGAAVVAGWLERWLQTEWPDLQVYLTSVTDHWATISLNGPDSRKVASAICDGIDFSNEAFPFMSVREGTALGLPVRVFRIAFAGELAYEINVDANYGREVWEAAIEAGQQYNITPYGTEAMHVLRAEKGFIIAGQDTDGSMSPQDMGLGRLVSDRKDFLGRRTLSAPDLIRTDRKQFVGLLAEDPAKVLPEGGQIVNGPISGIPAPMLGHVTSSYHSAFLGRSIALGLVRGGHARTGDTVYVSAGDDPLAAAKIASPVFFDPDAERQNVE